MKYGRKNHPPDSELKRELFICHLLEELRKKSDKRTRQILFQVRVYGRDDIKYIESEIKRRWNSDRTNY